MSVSQPRLFRTTIADVVNMQNDAAILTIYHRVPYSYHANAGIFPSIGHEQPVFMM